MKLCLVPVVGLLLVMLPHRSLSATFTVTNGADSGAGSLRQAFLDANTNPGRDEIAFNLPPGVKSIAVVGEQLPTITDPIVIDATKMPGYSGTPLVTIDGLSKANKSGLTLAAGNCLIRGLAINNFGTSGKTGLMYGIVIDTGPSNTIQACHVGIDAAGLVQRRNYSGGILVSNSSGNIIGGSVADARNVITGNIGAGVRITGISSSNNVVAGNHIGLGYSGTSAIGNGTDGVLIEAGASHNLVGGTEPDPRNVIAGNFSSQITIRSGASGNLVLGNFVGVAADGTALAAAPASANGIVIRDAPNNFVGDSEWDKGNLISGNNVGVLISGADSIGNRVSSNFIGTDHSGYRVIPNHTGIFVNATSIGATGPSGNLIGGTEPYGGNLVSGNIGDGISLSDSSGNRIQGNYVGTALDGRTPLSNGRAASQNAGIRIAAIFAPASGNLVGGTTDGSPNLISGNQLYGVLLVGIGATGNRIQRNAIGVDRTGTNALPNAGDGILVLGSAGNLIGGTNTPAGNIIAGNGSAGIELAGVFGGFGFAASNNVVAGNFIGLLPTPPAAKPAARRIAGLASGHRDAPLAALDNSYWNSIPDVGPGPYDDLVKIIRVPNQGPGILCTAAENTLVGPDPGSHWNVLAYSAANPGIRGLAGSASVLGSAFVADAADAAAPFVAFLPGFNPWNNSVEITGITPGPGGTLDHFLEFSGTAAPSTQGEVSTLVGVLGSRYSILFPFSGSVPFTTDNLGTFGGQIGVHDSDAFGLVAYFNEQPGMTPVTRMTRVLRTTNLGNTQFSAQKIVPLPSTCPKLIATLTGTTAGLSVSGTQPTEIIAFTPQPRQAVEILLSGGTPPYHVTAAGDWMGAPKTVDGIIGQFEITSAVNGWLPGNHTLSLEFSDANACTGNATFAITADGSAPSPKIPVPTVNPDGSLKFSFFIPTGTLLTIESATQLGGGWTPIYSANTPHNQPVVLTLPPSSAPTDAMFFHFYLKSE